MSGNALNTLTDMLREHPKDPVIQIDRSDAEAIVRDGAGMRDMAEALALRLITLSGGDDKDIEALQRLTESLDTSDAKASMAA